MPNHAGFGAVAVVREAVLQDAVTILHRAGVLPSRFTGEAEVPDPAPSGAGSTKLGWDLFLDTPRIALHAAEPLHVRLDVELVGKLQLLRPGQAAQEFRVRIEASLRLPPTVVTNAGSLGFGLAAGSLRIESHRVETWESPGFPAWLDAFLNSSGARDSVRAQLRGSLAEVAPVSPPLLGQVASQLGVLGLRITGTRLRVLDGAIALGINLAGASASSSFNLEGSYDQLRDFCRPGTNAAISVNERLAHLLLLSQRGQIEVQAAVEGIVIDSLQFHLEGPEPGASTGHIRVAGGASQNSFGALFEFVVRPVVEGRRVGVEIDRFNITGLPWWAYLLGIVGVALATPIGAIGIFRLILAPIVEFAEDAIGDSVSGTVSLDRTAVITLPGTTGPSVNFRIDHVRIGREGLDSSFTIRPNFDREVRIAGPDHIGPADGDVARYNLVGVYSVIHFADPTVRVSWDVRRIDGDTLITSVDLPLSDPNALTVALDTAGARPGARFRIACRLYRDQGDADVEFYRGAVEVQSSDPIDRSRPFVRWRHEVCRPFVTNPGVAGADRLYEYRWIERRSKIHRTDVPGRCRFAHRFSSDVLRVEDPSRPHAPVLEYLVELPFPREEMAAHRRQLCDYCFYGGPTRSDPLI